jgi:hypothetical protein
MEVASGLKLKANNRPSVCRETVDVRKVYWSAIRRQRRKQSVHTLEEETLPRIAYLLGVASLEVDGYGLGQ